MYLRFKKKGIGLPLLIFATTLSVATMAEQCSYGQYFDAVTQACQGKKNKLGEINYWAI